MKKLESVEQFDAIKSEGKSVFMFSADWCGDCKFIEPVMPEIEAENEDFVFYHVDRDEFIDLCADLAIFGIPS
ncbi:thioredoxin family protein, partial [Listeria monocytogenes]|nr:thioredoxin family protein [Listeria monocytogenes]